MAILGLGVLCPLQTATADAAPEQPRFQEQIVFQGLTKPTNFEFAPAAGDSRIFVTEKAGLVKEFDNLADATPTIVADLRSDTHDQWDRGMTGLAIAPNFPADPYIYVAYTYGVPLGGGPVRDDLCTGLTPSAGKCTVSARLSRLKINPATNVMVGAQEVLINDWCTQFPSHSIGDLKFGPDGYLYVSAGEGGSFTGSDWGQLTPGGPVNPCGDPVNEGGSLRSQDMMTPGDPTTLDGAVLRLNPVPGAPAAPGNPVTTGDANAKRIIAYGFRNPYHFTFRPGTSELWVGDVGYATWEEINRIPDPTASPGNFGWPCYEGNDVNYGFANADLGICRTLYDVGNPLRPYYTYNHNQDIDGSDAKCRVGGDSISGLAFAPKTGGSYPVQYKGALFFADYARSCIFAMLPDTAGGLPSPGNVELFTTGIFATDLNFGPDGELYIADYFGGAIRRYRYFEHNAPPEAVLNASITSGGAPLVVDFDATRSTDIDPADAGGLKYAWDFDSNGTVDATTPTARYTYTATGNYTAKLTVTDTLQVTDAETVAIHVGNDLPTAYIDSPAPGFTWAVGQPITFTGHAVDQGVVGNLPGTSLSWELNLEHCVTIEECHTHTLVHSRADGEAEEGTWPRAASVTLEAAPDHAYPSYLEIVLDAVDASGNHSIVKRRLFPKTVTMTFVSSRSGIPLTVAGVTQVAPFMRTFIQGSQLTVSAPGSYTYITSRRLLELTFVRWSNGMERTSVITAPATAMKSYVATYSSTQGRRTTAWSPGSAVQPGLRGRIPARLGIN
ncbi:glucose/arabinose dehydrogenase [Allocatelliglobosispora scoriae]|uniref:Glucose/arabinose dehydrogenase n=1 Tax=Allocatelliglobosispora scoriae TaxID=643052 RepID=A0A841BX46_9ACTN|nr:PQQ-dependent sugar dehydrogenase [Allocatelliglobosispora scoriae]MBB5872068.1 glucose/arabinose dehydrogenase [Allocatelliglobosispora scoriae]